MRCTPGAVSIRTQVRESQRTGQGVSLGAGPGERAGTTPATRLWLLEKVPVLRGCIKRDGGGRVPRLGTVEEEFRGYN